MVTLWFQSVRGPCTHLPLYHTRRSPSEGLLQAVRSLYCVECEHIPKRQTLSCSVNRLKEDGGTLAGPSPGQS